MVFHTSESLPPHLQTRFPDATVCLKPISSEVLLSKVKKMVDQTSTAAQTTTEFYVVQDVKTKKCTIVEKKPTTTTEFTVLGNMFKTRTEAESGMKTEKVCVTN